MKVPESVLGRRLPVENRHGALVPHGILGDRDRTFSGFGADGRAQAVCRAVCADVLDARFKHLESELSRLKPPTEPTPSARARAVGAPRGRAR